MSTPTRHMQGIRRSYIVACATEARALLDAIELANDDQLVPRVLEALAQLRQAESEAMDWAVTA